MEIVWKMDLHPSSFRVRLEWMEFSDGARHFSEWGQNSYIKNMYILAGMRSKAARSFLAFLLSF